MITWLLCYLLPEDESYSVLLCSSKRSLRGRGSRKKSRVESEVAAGSTLWKRGGI